MCCWLTGRLHQTPWSATSSATFVGILVMLSPGIDPSKRRSGVISITVVKGSLQCGIAATKCNHMLVAWEK